jgi:VanZ family protein
MSRSPHLSHLLTVAWALLIGLLLLLPVDAYDPAGQGWLDRLLDSLPWIDKAVHAALFGVMALLARRSFAVAGVERAALRTVLLTMAYGVLMEALQAFVPGRSPSGLDMMANTVGAVAGAIMSLSPGRSPKEAGTVPLTDRRVVSDPVVEEPDA